MIDESFIFLPKIGEVSERKIWHQCNNWDDFLGNTKLEGFSKKRKEHLDKYIINARSALNRKDWEFLSLYFPQNQHWRLWSLLKENPIFLDIETTGYYGDVTVVGLYNGVDSKILVRGQNLDRYLIQKALEGCTCLITFNGASFDLPVLKKFFNIDFRMPHIDLRFVAKRLGYSGGLKKIERTLRLCRDEDIQDMDGCEAITLWNLWCSTGNFEYVDRLVRYNEADIVNLQPLAELLIPQLWEKTRY